MIVVSIIGLLASLAIPSIAKSRETSRLNVIYNNLRELETAKDQWALENNFATGTAVADVSMLRAYLRYGSPQPVIHEVYVPNAVGEPPQANLPPGVGLGAFGPGASISMP
jgi:type II secretory pathway pseudopilin PulG